MQQLETKEPKREPAVQSIPIKEIERTGNIREVDDKELQELVASIRAQGILQALRLAPQAKEGKPYRLVFGFRRIRAAELAGLQAVPCTVQAMTEAEIREEQLNENLQRTDLSPLDEARGFQGYLEATKATQVELARKIGKSQPYIANRIRLLELPEEAKEAISHGIITASHGEVLASIPKGVPKELLREILRDAKEQDVKSLKHNIDWRLSGWRGRQEQLKREETWRKSLKVPDCPKCKKPAIDKVGKFDGFPDNTVGCAGPWERDSHFWNPTTGEIVERKLDRSGVGRAKAKPAKKEKVARDFAVFFSRAPMDKWAQAFLQEVKAGGISELQFDGNGLSANAGKATGFPRLEVASNHQDLYLSPVEIPDGAGGKFVTRVQVGNFRSTPSARDDVVEGRDVAGLKQARAKLLEFQIKKVGVRQSLNDLWPKHASGFMLGEKVRIGDRAAWSSYRGKHGVIMAFDVGHADYYSGKLSKGGLEAVLDLNAGHKRHQFSTLEKLDGEKPKIKKKPGGRGPSTPKLSRKKGGTRKRSGK